jgi:RNA polymerase sigma-70 factor (ECF subfamily)
LKKNRFELVEQEARQDEADLIREAKIGKERAFEKLFRLHKDRVFSICMRMTGNFYEAEDLLQESFAQAFKHITGFRGDASFGTWLYRVTVNVVIEALRKTNPHLERSFVECGVPESSGVPQHAAGGDLTIERLRLERAIAALAPGYRIVLVLHDVEGYNHEEIARHLGSSIGTCKSQLHKARKKLRELLLEG